MPMSVLEGRSVSKQELRRHTEHIAPSAYVDAKAYLAAVYQALKEKLERYSYIRFTEDMGFGACNAMYLIIRGQRPLTVKGAAKIIAALGLKGVERRYFLKLVEALNPTGSPDRDAAFDDLVELKAQAVPTTLDRDQLQFYNEWRHAVILELLSLPDAPTEPAGIGQAIVPPVTELKVKASLELLAKLGHIAYDKKQGRWAPTQETLSTGNEVYGLAVMRYHQQMIALAKDALTDVAPLERDISAVTIALPLERLDELKERIQAFRKEILELSAAGGASADGIVQVNIQMFPVGRTAGRSTKDDE
jgi:uncharacterized protein (TIGR02147 family)